MVLSCRESALRRRGFALPTYAPLVVMIHFQRTMSNRRLVESSLRAYGAKHQQQLQRAAEAFCSNSIADLEAKMIPSGIPCCNLATGTTTITPPTGTGHVVVTRGLTTRSGTNLSMSEMVPTSYVLVSPLAGGDLVFPLDNGSTCVLGAIQAPILSAANYVPFEYASEAVGLIMGISNVAAAVSGLAAGACFAGTSNNISTMTAVRGPKKPPVGTLMAPFGPLTPEGLEPLDTICVIFKPAGNTKVPLTDDVSPWYIKETAVTWNTPGTSAVSVAGASWNPTFVVSLNPDLANTAVEWLSSITVPDRKSVV